jgi:hypothetical protein
MRIGLQDYQLSVSTRLHWQVLPTSASGFDNPEALLIEETGSGQRLQLDGKAFQRDKIATGATTAGECWFLHPQNKIGATCASVSPGPTLPAQGSGRAYFLRRGPGVGTLRVKRGLLVGWVC